MIMNAVLPLWLAFIILFLLLAVTVYLELKRESGHRALRLTSAILLVVALALIMFRPLYPAPDKNEILLLTEGYSPSTVDSLLKSASYTLKHFGEIKSYRGSKTISATDLISNAGNISIVTGTGLERTTLDKLSFAHKGYNFLPSVPPTGVTNLSIPPCAVNRECQINGYINITEECTLRLVGPGGSEDSVHFSNTGRQAFKLQFHPKQSGNFMYALEFATSATVMSDPLPVTITQGPRLKILFLQQHPSFENNTIKNFLENEHHQLVVRYQVSRSSFRFEYINHAKVDVNRITPELLSAFDLVISDSPTLTSLSKGEQSVITSAIQSGLGLMNIGPATGRSANAFFPFEVIPSNKDTIRRTVAGNSIGIQTSRFRVAVSPETTVLYADAVGTLTGYTTIGLGKIGFQLMHQTFPLSLSGDSLAYANLWTPLLERVARASASTNRLSIETPFPWFENEPIDIRAISAGDAVPTLTSDSIVLPILEDAAIDNVWHTRTWAGKPGWHSIEDQDGEKLHYWVAGVGDWKSLSLANQLRANHLRFSETTSVVGQNAMQWKSIPEWIGYFLFLLSAGFLWLAPKL